MGSWEFFFYIGKSSNFEVKVKFLSEIMEFVQILHIWLFGSKINQFDFS